MKYFLPILLLAALHAPAQSLTKPADKWNSQRWDAHWIAPPDVSLRQYGVYHFRKKFTLWEAASSFVINISGDNKYRLYVNGNYVTEGPQLGDPRHWHYETIDIAPMLRKGDNTVAVLIWNYGDESPEYLMGKKSALIVQGNGDTEKVINTDKSWKVFTNPGISPVIFRAGMPELFWQYYAAGPLEKTDGSKFPWGWEAPAFDDSKWSAARELLTGAPHGVVSDEYWELVPRTLPPMEHRYQSLPALRRAENFSVAGKQVSALLPLTIPAKKKVTLLFDQQQLTTAFPEYVFSKGKGATVKATYAEALYNDIRNIGHRDSITGKSIHGVYDLILPDGGTGRTYTSLSYRTFRYIQFDIQTGDEPLTIDKLGSYFTGYPFQKVGSFSASDTDLSRVFDVGWHTQELCAYDTYMDCPYWERLQYIGDTRIQALVSYYVSGDVRLARNAIEQFEWSLQQDGLTYSRYPSALQQYIPNYSLCWVTMVYDFFLYRHDQAFVEARMPNVRRVMDHFKSYINEDGLFTLQPYWDFLDHSFSAKKIFEESEKKSLTSNTLFYAYTLDMVARIEAQLGNAAAAAESTALSEKLKATVKEKCWSQGRSLFADSPDQKHFSMHTNILAILCGLVPDKAQTDMIKILVNDNSITRTTLYFDFYLGRAMNQAGAGDLYLQLLDKWKSLLNLGLSTFPEGVERSECHAWSASPDYEMLATFCGVQPDAPGYEKVVIKPLMGSLTSVKGVVPHWAGKMEVDLTRTKDGVKGRIVLPPGITGKLLWENREIPLRAGAQAIDVKPLIETIIKKKK
ncbi:MAG: alpha-L-rhamnosidase N-terminal domain-containing protein [Cyclobacteriaceae bacterium]